MHAGPITSASLSMHMLRLPHATSCVSMSKDCCDSEFKLTSTLATVTKTGGGEAAMKGTSSAIRSMTEKSRADCKYYKTNVYDTLSKEPGLEYMWQRIGTTLLLKCFRKEIDRKFDNYDTISVLVDKKWCMQHHLGVTAITLYVFSLNPR